MTQLLGDISVKKFFPFPKIPKLFFKPDDRFCPICAQDLGVKKTRKKTAATMDIGMFSAYETILTCNNDKCASHRNHQYFSQKLLELIPYRCKFGYDVLVFVGKKLFLQCRNIQEIKSKLKESNIAISESEIEYLAKKFILYLAIAHKESREKLKKFMNQKGGYILHLDSTCQGDSPHLMVALDGISEIVLESIKLPSEKAEKIIPLLKRIKKNYGVPLALVHDMGKGILAAIKEVFPGVPDYICHFHFLRDIGKDLFGKENDIIRNHLKKYGILGLLRKRARKLKKDIEKNPKLADFFLESRSRSMNLNLNLNLNNKEMSKPMVEVDLMTPVMLYTLIIWALEGKKQAKGYGFPFDRPHLSFYQRLQAIHLFLNFLRTQLKFKTINQENTNAGKENKDYKKVLNDLDDIIYDSLLRETAEKMQDKIAIFDQLRDAMRIASPDGNYGLNDNGDQNIGTIQRRVKSFYNKISKNKDLIKDDGYKKMIAQIEQYWGKLFADPIVIDTQTGKLSIQPQRTNNILEGLFRDFKRRFRKKSGLNTLSRNLKSILAETPLIKNLENKEYLNIILNGKERLEERFAEIDGKIVREELLKQKDTERIPPKIKKIIENSKSIEDLIEIFVG
jgi:hypothetical protein